MALVDCPECGHGFSQYAKTCPKCNFPNPLARYLPGWGRALTKRRAQELQPAQPFPLLLSLFLLGIDELQDRVAAVQPDAAADTVPVVLLPVDFQFSAQILDMDPGAFPFRFDIGHGVCFDAFHRCGDNLYAAICRVM